MELRDSEPEALEFTYEMQRVHKGKKAQSAVKVFETTLGTPGKTANNSGTVTAGVT